MPSLILHQSRSHLCNHNKHSPAMENVIRSVFVQLVANQRLSYHSANLGEIHTAGLGVIASKLWNSGSSKQGGFRTIYAPLFLYLSSVAFKTK